ISPGSSSGERASRRLASSVTDRTAVGKCSMRGRRRGSSARTRWATDGVCGSSCPTATSSCAMNPPLGRGARAAICRIRPWSGGGWFRRPAWSGGRAGGGAPGGRGGCGGGVGGRGGVGRRVGRAGRGVGSAVVGGGGGARGAPRAALLGGRVGSAGGGGTRAAGGPWRGGTTVKRGARG